MREREKGLFFLPPLFPLSLEFETGTDWKEREKNVEWLPETVNGIEALRDDALVLENAGDAVALAPLVERNGAGAKTKWERRWTILNHVPEIKTEKGKTTLSWNKHFFKYLFRERDRDRKRRRSRSRDKDREQRKKERRERREREKGEKVDYIKTDDGGEIRIKEEPVDGA